MCSGGGVRNYADPAGPPGSEKTPVPDWMVRDVLEQRHMRRITSYKGGTKIHSDLDDEDEQETLIGKETLGG